MAALLRGEGVVRFATRNRRAAASCKGNSKQQHARHIKIESHVMAALAAALLRGGGVVRFATRNRRAAASCKYSSKQQHARHMGIESHVMVKTAPAAAWGRCGALGNA
jgi:hypothetical protein